MGEQKSIETGQTYRDAMMDDEVEVVDISEETVVIRVEDSKEYDGSGDVVYRDSGYPHAMWNEAIESGRFDPLGEYEGVVEDEDEKTEAFSVEPVVEDEDGDEDTKGEEVKTTESEKKGDGDESQQVLFPDSVEEDEGIDPLAW